MASNPPAADDAAAPDVGEIKRYPVDQPDGSTRCQLVLITRAADEHGAVRGRVLCYEDETAQFQPASFA